MNLYPEPAGRRRTPVIRILAFLLAILCLQEGQVSAQSPEAGSPGNISSPEPRRESRERKFDLIHTRLDLGVSFEKQSLSGTALLLLRPYFYPQTLLELDARGLEIKGVYALEGKAGGASPAAWPRDRKLDYSYDRRTLRIRPGRSLAAQDTLAVLIDYSTGNDDPPLRAEKGFYFINPSGKDPDQPVQLWTHGEPESSSRWFPTLDTPNEKFTQDIFLTVDNDFQTLSNGLLVESFPAGHGKRTDHWRQSAPHPAYLSMVAAGRFAVVRDRAKSGVELSYYVEPAYAPHVRAIFGRTPLMIDFFAGIFGVPYPWEKYAQIAVRDFVAGAMENTSATVHGEGIQQDSISLLDGNSDGIIAHEIAHQWFGNLVTCEEWGQLPLNESFANYAEYLWAEHHQGKAEADYLNYLELTSYLEEAARKQVPLIRYRYGTARDMFDNHSYAKGGRVLHMLRKYVGDEAFFASLRVYLSRYRFKATEIHHLRLVFEETTGRDLKWFFDQWFLRAGHPVLEVSQHADPERRRLRLTIRQVQDTLASSVFRLPVQVGVWTGSGKTVHGITVCRAEEEFVISLDGEPELVVVDAGADLLAEIRHQKRTDEWIRQYLNADHVVLRWTALDSLAGEIDSDRVTDLVIRALEDPFRMIRQKAAGLFAGYKGGRLSTVETKLRQMAKADPDPVVRAEAIWVLGTLAAQGYAEFLKGMLNDPSYFVVSVALEAYLRTGPADAPKVAERFRSAPDAAILDAVGMYYATAGKGGRYGWFAERLGRMKAAGQYNFVQTFGKYLLGTGKAEQQKGLQLLEFYLRNAPSFRVRFGAYQAMALFYEKPEVVKVLREVREAEANGEFREMLKTLGDFE